MLDASSGHLSTRCELGPVLNTGTTCSRDTESPSTVVRLIETKDGRLTLLHELLTTHHFAASVILLPEAKIGTIIIRFTCVLCLMAQNDCYELFYLYGILLPNKPWPWQRHYGATPAMAAQCCMHSWISANTLRISTIPMHCGLCNSNTYLDTQNSSVLAGRTARPSPNGSVLKPPNTLV